MPIQLIVGLRNADSAYTKTRHNAGAWFVEELTESCHASFKTDLKLKGDVAQLTLDHTTLKAFLPLGYMNNSGVALRAIVQFYKIPPQDILIAHDDLDLPAGRIKLKSGGGHGGHNGLRDIITQLGSQDFHRLRIGIGHPGHRDRVLDYVLGIPSGADKNNIIDAISRCIHVMPNVFEGNLALAMNQINR